MVVGDEEPSFASDAFAFGVVLWELATWRAPFLLRGRLEVGRGAGGEGDWVLWGLARAFQPLTDPNNAPPSSSSFSSFSQFRCSNMLTFPNAQPPHSFLLPLWSNKIATNQRTDNRTGGPGATACAEPVVHRQQRPRGWVGSARVFAARPWPRRRLPGREPAGEPAQRVRTSRLF